MFMKKKKQVTLKKVSEKVSRVLTKENFDRTVDEMSKIGGEAKKMIFHAKARFDRADEKTKKKILAGLAGATAVLAAIIGVRKMRRKKK